MVTNDRIRRLVETDREALVQLMAAAYAAGGHGWISLGSDPDARELINEVKNRACAQHIDRDRLTRWNAEAAALARWNDVGCPGGALVREE